GNFRALIEGSPDAIFVHRGGAVVFANQAAHKVLRCPDATQLCGRPWSDVAQADDGRGAPGEQRFRRLDGQTVVAEVAALSLVFDGHPATMVVARDVTERKELQARLLLADRLASVGTLAAGVAHEINNPLAYVMANLEFLAGLVPDLAAALPERSVDLEDS